MKLNCLILGAGGIGSAIANQIAMNYPHANIILTYRSNQPKLTHTNIQFMKLDATQEQKFIELANDLKQQSIKLDWLINTIGILHDSEIKLFPEKKLNDINIDHFQNVIQLNVLPTILAAKHLLPLFNRSNQSVFAVISAKVGSISDNRLGGWYSYRASKACLNMIIKNLSLELSLKYKNLCVLSLHPGTTDTKLSEPFQKNVPQGNLFTADQSAKYILSNIQKTNPNQTGKFLSWDGSEIKW